jgi:hypothetical protein
MAAWFISVGALLTVDFVFLLRQVRADRRPKSGVTRGRRWGPGSGYPKDRDPAPHPKAESLQQPKVSKKAEMHAGRSNRHSCNGGS